MRGSRGWHVAKVLSAHTKTNIIIFVPMIDNRPFQPGKRSDCCVQDFSRSLHQLISKLTSTTQSCVTRLYAMVWSCWLSISTVSAIQALLPCAHAMVLLLQVRGPWSMGSWSKALPDRFRGIALPTSWRPSSARLFAQVVAQGPRWHVFCCAVIGVDRPD